MQVLTKGSDYRNIWETQEIMTILYDKTKNNIRSHLVKVFKENEIDDAVTAKEFLTVQMERLGKNEYKKRTFGIKR